MPDEEAEPKDEMIPKSRLDAKQRKIDALIAELETARSQQAEVQSAFDAFRVAAETDTHLLRAGITDPEAMDLVRYRHGRLPEDGRPSLAEWVTDGAKVDPFLASLFAAPPPKTDAAPPVAQASPPARPPSNNAGAAPPPPPASGHTVRWWNGLSIAEKAAQRAQLGGGEVDSGLAGKWPIG